MFQLALVNNIDGPFRTHDRDFRCRPGVVHIGANVFRRHHAVRTAISLARDDRDLRYRRFGEGIEQLGSVSNNPAILLRRSRQKARHVLKSNERDVEAIAKAHKPSALDRRVDIERASQERRLIRDDAHRLAAQPRKPNHQVLGVVFLHLKEVAVIGHVPQHVLHVVGLIRFRRDESVERGVGTIHWIATRLPRRLFQIVRRHKAE